MQNKDNTGEEALHSFARRVARESLLEGFPGDRLVSKEIVLFIWAIFASLNSLANSVGQTISTLLFSIFTRFLNTIRTLLNIKIPLFSFEKGRIQIILNHYSIQTLSTTIKISTIALFRFLASGGLGGAPRSRTTGRFEVMASNTLGGRIWGRDLRRPRRSNLRLVGLLCGKGEWVVLSDLPKKSTYS